MPGPSYPGRPDHPDFWLIVQAVLDTDAAADSRQAFNDIIGRYADPDSVAYMASQRALRLMRAGQPAGVMARQAQLGAGWIDGFLAGAAFQRAKSAPAPDGLQTGSTEIWAHAPDGKDQETGHE
jgi:hypothetical protein